MNFQTAQQIIKLNKESFNSIASSFSDSRQNPWPEVELAIKKYIKPDDRILDLGCGNGRLLKSLPKNIFYFGLDSSEKLIEEAQKHKSIKTKKQEGNGTMKQWGNERVKFICGDILNLNQFKDKSFNIIFMIASFHHIPSKELRQKVLINLHRILMSGGYLIMTNWNLWQFKNKKGVWYNLFSKKNQKGLGFKDLITLWQNKYPLYYHAFTLSELNKVLSKNNFEVLENKFISQAKKVHFWNARNILTISRKI